MKKDELMQLVGKRVRVIFTDCGGGEIIGVLGYTKGFSAAYGWRKPNYFTVEHINFKVSLLEKVEVLEK